MELYDTYLGNKTEDDDLASHVESEGARRLTLDETTRRRSRFRTKADDGTDVGVIATNEGSLQPGDILAGDAGLLVVALAEREALIVDFSGVTATTDALASATKLGHVVGNRHRDLAVRRDEVLIALESSPDRHRNEIRSYLPQGATTRIEGVDPTCFDDGTPDHRHDDRSGHDGHEHTHSENGRGEHSHSGRGHIHTHTHGEGEHEHAHGSVRTPDFEEEP